MAVPSLWPLLSPPTATRSILPQAGGRVNLSRRPARGGDNGLVGRTCFLPDSPVAPSNKTLAIERRASRILRARQGDQMTQDGGDRTPETFDPLRDKIARQATELDRRQSTIDQQAGEIERLKRRLADESMLDELREAVRLSVTAEAISAPVSHSR